MKRITSTTEEGRPIRRIFADEEFDAYSVCPPLAGDWAYQRTFNGNWAGAVGRGDRGPGGQDMDRLPLVIRRPGVPAPGRRQDAGNA
jgi:hypothetical protein